MPSTLAAPLPPPAPSGPRCPLCNRKLVRTKRHLADRLISLVTPVQRYYCIDFGCHWQGRVRMRDIDAATPFGVVAKNGADALS